MSCFPEQGADLSQNLQELGERIAHLERRLARLEAAAGQPASPVVLAAATVAMDPIESEEPTLLQAAGLTPTAMVFLLGRSILVLAGAFLLRFTTESGTLPPLAGFGLGLTYALVLTGLAFQQGRVSAVEGVAHGVTGAIVAFPFLYESIVTLKLVGPLAGGGALALVATAGLLTAWYRRLRALAWMFTLPALGLVGALGFATAEPVFYAWLLVALGAGTTLLAYSRGWDLKRWLVAGLADAVIFRLSVLAADQTRGLNQGVLPVDGVQMLCVGLLAAYLGLFVFRALVQGRGVRAFHLCQSAAVLLIGFGGALRIAEAKGTGTSLLGLVAVVAALVGYAIAFRVVRQRHGRGRAFFYFASLGLVFLILGSDAVAGGAVLSGTWLALALVTAILGTRFDRVTLRAHSVVYLLIAGFQTGLIRSSLDAFTAGGHATWHQAGAMGLIALAVTAVVALILNRLRGSQDTGRWGRVPRFLALLLVLPGLSQLAVLGLVGLFGSLPPMADPHAVAAIRTGVMSLLAIGLALTARRPVLRDLRWLVYPVLGLELLKVVVEDLRLGSPLGLFFGFGLLGGALILAPRFLRQRQAVAGPLAEED